MSQANSIEQFLKSSKSNPTGFGTLGGRISNAYDTLQTDSVDRGYLSPSDNGDFIFEAK